MGSIMKNNPDGTKAIWQKMDKSIVKTKCYIAHNLNRGL